MKGSTQCLLSIPSSVKPNCMNIRMIIAAVLVVDKFVQYFLVHFDTHIQTCFKQPPVEESHLVNEVTSRPDGLSHRKTFFVGF